MNCDCYKIEILNSPSFLESFHSDSDGKVYLDSYENKSLNLSDSLSQLTALGKLKIDGIIGITVPDTPKNRIILDPYINSSIIDNENTFLNVRIWKGVRTLRQRWLYVLSKKDGKYFVQATYNKDHWAIKMKDYAIKEIYDGSTFELTYDNIWDSQDNNYEYDSADDGFYFPTLWYGGSFYPGRLLPEDFRPLLHLTHILQKGACLNGWKLDCPILDTTFFKKFICYFLKENYGEEDFDPIDFSFVAKINNDTLTYPSDWDQDTDFIVNFQFDVENDPSGYLSTGVPYAHTFVNISPNVMSDFTLKVKLKFEGLIRSTQAEIEAVLYTINEDGDNVFTIIDSQTIVQNYFDGILDPNMEIEINLSHELFQHVSNIDQQLYFRWRENQDRSEAVYGSRVRDPIILEAKLFNKPVRTKYSEGSIINIKETIDEKYKYLDALAAFQHLIRAKITTDHNTKTIKIRPSVDIDVYGESVDGFYTLTSSKDVANEVICDSIEVNNPNYKKDRYRQLRFKKSTDKHIENKQFNDNNQPFEKKIDLGERFQDSTKYDPNPLWEPTVMGPVPEILYQVDDSFVPPYLSFLTDNDEGKVSYKIGARLLLATRRTTQTIDGTPSNIRVQQGSIITWSYPYMKLDENIGSAIGLDLTEMIVYGEGDYDIWNNYYQYDYLREYLMPLYIAKIKMFDSDYFGLDFGLKLKFNVFGKTTFGNVQSIAYQGCKRIGAVSMIPDIQSTKICIDYPELLVCNNSPVLSVSYDGGSNCYTITLVGINESPITNVDFEYQFQNTDGSWPSTWTPLANLTALSAELCSINKKTKIRALVQYQSINGLICEDKYTPITILDPCGNNPSLEFVVTKDTNGDPQVEIIVGGNYMSTIDTVTINISINGGASQPYTLGTVITQAGMTEVCILEGTITWVDGCPDSEFENICQIIDVTVGECSQVNIGFSASALAPSFCWNFQNTGDYIADEAIDDFILVQQWDPHGGEWIGQPKRWDGFEVCSDKIRARRVALICEPNCIICTDWQEYQLPS